MLTATFIICVSVIWWEDVGICSGSVSVKTRDSPQIEPNYLCSMCCESVTTVSSSVL